MFTEAPQQVRAHAVGDLVSLTFGDDLSGVRFMGRRDDLWHLIGQAGRALHDVTDDPEHG
jgi:hypothetical protein